MRAHENVVDSRAESGQRIEHPAMHLIHRFPGHDSASNPALIFPEEKRTPGKFSHLDFILPLLPTTYRHYCEPFGGSAAVLINRKPADVETYNDIDSEVANFFACLREDGEELIRHIGLTPFSREELVRAHKPDRGLTQLERARRFFVRARQTRTGLAQTSSEGRWAHCVLTSRAGMAGGR